MVFGQCRILAIASARVFMNQAAFTAIRDGAGPKGDAIRTAELAGIMASKRTADLIPLCHPLPLSKVTLDLACDAALGGVLVTAECRTTGPTGVEMEALTAASVAALTVYDMCKAVDRGMRITEVRLRHKSGGKSGTFEAE